MKLDKREEYLDAFGSFSVPNKAKNTLFNDVKDQKKQTEVVTD